MSKSKTEEIYEEEISRHLTDKADLLYENTRNLALWKMLEKHKCDILHRITDGGWEITIPMRGTIFGGVVAVGKTPKEAAEKAFEFLEDE